ncbi:restriction endonuclease [Clostridium chauvoei]|uniref:Restriction endonuclease n=2 Tax=Clostridium chauvoei TaxID=46867 RepID=A0ABD4RJT4_9CLOT|nr:restriction endonuclease [Clostridium chauvoei]ATD54547.1 restriction endonuclease [Clostridium chauvoei]ATD57771.1 restriction endonuclease [Clostridium chauvoei]MBX7281553.1 restriction endonuclease [Clostridium chauvoei]MBX7284073.1 restriction endonuclease [Clostridium chauvoei]MBX7286601.1 restriction endonuclease [Clostridium chauvoei]
MFKYKYDELIEPCFKVIKQLGGSATNVEIREKLIEILNLSEEEIDDIHRNSTTKLDYRTGWAKNYLKNAGYIINSARSVWSLTDEGNKVNNVDKDEVKFKAKEKIQDDSIVEENKVNECEINEFYDDEEHSIDDYNWHNRIIEVVKKISPDKFENLCQRLLRELGFSNVEVTGKSHDGGIDGKGILKLGGVLSFHVAFQAKRYEGTVSSSVVRDFRGAMMGRADKGLIITTGVFSREAVKEATRDGATPIDLIDGNDLAKHLKELGLGVEVKVVEKVIINEDWFKNI